MRLLFHMFGISSIAHQAKRLGYYEFMQLTRSASPQAENVTNLREVRPGPLSVQGTFPNKVLTTNAAAAKRKFCNSL